MASLSILPAARSEIIFRAGYRLRIPLVFIRRTKRRPAKCGRAQIADAHVCVPPASIGIRVTRQPIEATRNQRRRQDGFFKDITTMNRQTRKQP